MKTIRRTVALVAVILLALLALASPAAAAKPKTIDIAWVTSLAPGVTTPHGANDVTWPQHLADYGPNCGVLQIDTYLYDTPAHVAFVQALQKHEVLNKPGSKDWTDTAVVISFRFFLSLPPCVMDSDTPSPSSTITSPVMTPSSTPISSTSTSATPSSSTPATVALPLPSTTMTSIAASSTPSPTVTAAPKPKPTPSASPTQQLPFTGFPTGLLIALGVMLVMVGWFAIRQTTRDPKHQ